MERRWDLTLASARLSKAAPQHCTISLRQGTTKELASGAFKDVLSCSLGDISLVWVGASFLALPEGSKDEKSSRLGRTKKIITKQIGCHMMRH